MLGDFATSKLATYTSTDLGEVEVCVEFHAVVYWNYGIMWEMRTIAKDEINVPITLSVFRDKMMRT